jgi:hypothetical protein
VYQILSQMVITFKETCKFDLGSLNGTLDWNPPDVDVLDITTRTHHRERDANMYKISPSMVNILLLSLSFPHPGLDISYLSLVHKSLKIVSGQLRVMQRLFLPLQELLAQVQ